MQRLRWADERRTLGQLNEALLRNSVPSKQPHQLSRKCQPCFLITLFHTPKTMALLLTLQRPLAHSWNIKIMLFVRVPPEDTVWAL